MAKALLDVLRVQRSARRPVWLMRQAGRYLPEYREVREKAGSFLGLCYDPGMATEVTLQPLRRFDLDAAIVFADILVVPHAMGCSLDFVEGEGPLLSTVRSAADMRVLHCDGKAWQFERVYETLQRVKAELAPHVALIGFCGAPWTVASYMIEGRASDRALALEVAEAAPKWFEDLVEQIIVISISYLVGQIRAGAEVVQIFDSWAGDLKPASRERWVHAPVRDVILGVRAVFPDFPVIVFARGLGSGHAGLAVATAANAVSIEQGQGLAEVLRAVPDGVVVQGNLAPEILAGGEDLLAKDTTRICSEVPMGHHIFNLGHGILPHTPPENLSALLRAVRLYDSGAP